MSSGAQSFKFTELRRAVLAVQSAGIKIGKITVGKNGAIEITPADGVKSNANDTTNAETPEEIKQLL